MHCEPVDDAHRIAGLSVEDVQLRNEVVRVVLVPEEKKRFSFYDFLFVITLTLILNVKQIEIEE